MTTWFNDYIILTILSASKNILFQAMAGQYDFILMHWLIHHNIQTKSNKAGIIDTFIKYAAFLRNTHFRGC